MKLRSYLSPVDQHRFDRYAKLFGSETDRGAAVLAGEYLSSLLEELLRAVLVPSSQRDRLFELYGPLSSFSGRIDIAFACGLLRESTHSDLHLLRKVRNHFAHHPDEVAFGVSPVREWCLEFSTTRQEVEYFGTDADAFRRDARLQFVLAVQVAMFAITSLKQAIAPFQALPELS